MFKALRKISGHSKDGDNDKNVFPRKKDVNKDLRRPYNPKTAQYPRQAPAGNGEHMSQSQSFRTIPSSGTDFGAPAGTLPYQKSDSNRFTGISTETNVSMQGSASYMVPETHEALIRQNQVNRKKSEQYYIYNLERYRGPTDEEVSVDPEYNVFEVANGINATSARYVIHYLTKAFKQQLNERFSNENADLETDVLKASMEIFKPNLSHFSTAEIAQCKKIIRAFFPWDGCSLTGNALEKAISENYGDYSNSKHWKRLILSLRIIWSYLPEGIVSWKYYEDFSRIEASRGYPMKSFYNLLPPCLPNHDYTCTAFEFLETLVAIISKVDLVVDKNAQLDLIFTAGQVCFVNDEHLQNRVRNDKRNDADLILLSKLYYTRGYALLHLFVGYLRSLAEDGKIKDFYLIDNFNIDRYPPHPYKPVTQSALTLTVPSFTDSGNDFNTLIKQAAKAQSRIYSSNHSFSKVENSFLDMFEEDPSQVFDTLFSKSSKRYLYKFDKNFNPNSLKMLSESGIQKALENMAEKDQYSVATWIDHCKGQDFSEFLNVLDDTGLGEGTLAFDSSAFNSVLKKGTQKESFSPVRVSKMGLSEWFISSWKYETFLNKVHNTLLIKLTKRIGDCDWLVLTTDERVGKACYLTPPTSSDSAKALSINKNLSLDLDNASIKSRPPPPNLLGDKSRSPLMDVSSAASIRTNSIRRSGLGATSYDRTGKTPAAKPYGHTTAPPVPNSISERKEMMTPIENKNTATFPHGPSQTQRLPPFISKINNPSLMDVNPARTDTTSKTLDSDFRKEAPKESHNDQTFASLITSKQQFAKPLDFGVRSKSSSAGVETCDALQPLHSSEDDEHASLVSANTLEKLKENSLDDPAESSEGETYSENHDSLEVCSVKEVDNASDVLVERPPPTETEQVESVKVDTHIFSDTNAEMDVSGPSPDGSKPHNSPAKNTRDSVVRSESSFVDAMEVSYYEEDESIKSGSDTNNNDHFNNHSSMATTAESVPIEKTNVQTVIVKEEGSPIEDKKRVEPDVTNKSVTLTPSSKLMRASALIDTQTSPDILNDLIDNYNSESIVTVNSEGATLFEMIKSQMEKLSNGKDLPPVPENCKPELAKLQPVDDNDVKSEESIPLVTPTKATATLMSGFSYNATPPMKPEPKFDYRSGSAHQQSSQQFSVSKTEISSDNSESSERNRSSPHSEISDFDTCTEAIIEQDKKKTDENTAFKSVMLKTRKSIKNLRVKSLRT